MCTVTKPESSFDSAPFLKPVAPKTLSSSNKPKMQEVILFSFVLMNSITLLKCIHASPVETERVKREIKGWIFQYFYIIFTQLPSFFNQRLVEKSMKNGKNCLGFEPISF